MSARAAGPWERVREGDGIVVQRRHIDGGTLDELRGNGAIDAPLAAVMAVLQDSDRGAEWMFECAEHMMLERIGPDTEIVYHRSKLPWPLADRDAVLRGTRIFDPRQVRFVFETVSYSARPPVDGVVRMALIRGQWVLTPTDGNRSTLVEYQLSTDPGGALPRWLVNRFARTTPYEAIRRLRMQVARRLYPDVERQLAEQPEYRAIVGTR